MTQITVTLENGADSSLLKKMIENMKGVLRATISTVPKKSELEKQQAKVEDWINKMNRLSDSIDPTIVDMSDERTRFIMSK